MTPEERKIKAKEYSRKLHPENNNQSITSDNPAFLSFQALVEFVKLLADTGNDAFTQFDKGKLVDVFIDETKSFATAEHFANHPLDDIEEELSARGIFEKVGNEDGTYENIPIHFEIKPLKDYVTELKKKRHAVNRERVSEIIRLAQAARLGEIANPVPIRPQQATNPNDPRIRL